jgi:hypothetical protein
VLSCKKRNAKKSKANVTFRNPGLVPNASKNSSEIKQRLTRLLLPERLQGQKVLLQQNIKAKNRATAAR